jgi:prepilin-type processing-associated H-X9-DG protein
MRRHENPHYQWREFLNSGSSFAPGSRLPEIGWLYLPGTPCGPGRAGSVDFDGHFSQAGARSGGQAIQCLKNLRQLIRASSMYCADNKDALPMVFHGGYVPSGNDPNRPWVTGWLDWSSTPDNTNVIYLLNSRYASLAAYFAREKRIYKCPADVFISASQRALGWEQRVRSVSANVYVGKANAWATGSWGGGGGPNNLTIYKGAAKATDLLIPGAARTWVYLDEHPDSMNDGGSFAPDSATDLPDAPATYHDGAAGVAMADGHCEMHRWTGPAMTKPRALGGAAGVSYGSYNNFATVRGDPDLFWLSFGTPRWSPRTVAD